MHDDFIFSAAAEKEIEESFDWYEERSPGLGARFINTIDSSLNSIARSPEAFSKKKANNREFVVKKFPYIIVYRFLKKENAIYVLHVFHTSRNPKIKYKRK